MIYLKREVKHRNLNRKRPLQFEQKPRGVLPLITLTMIHYKHSKYPL